VVPSSVLFGCQSCLSPPLRIRDAQKLKISSFLRTINHQIFTFSIPDLSGDFPTLPLRSVVQRSKSPRPKSTPLGRFTFAREHTYDVESHHGRDYVDVVGSWLAKTDAAELESHNDEIETSSG
jgi:hypothetical protein